MCAKCPAQGEFLQVSRVPVLAGWVPLAGGVTGERRGLGNFSCHPALAIGLWLPVGVPESSGCTEIFHSHHGKAIHHVSGQQNS